VAGTTSTVRLDVYKHTYNGDILINTSELTTSSGTILVGIGTPENDTTYTAKAIVELGPDENLIDSLDKRFTTAPNFGFFGVFLTIILTIMFAFVGFFSLAVMVVLVPLPLLFASIIGLVNISVGYAIVFEIVAVIIAVILRQ
jgi:hypothetical protein